MIRALFGPSSTPYVLREGLDVTMQRHREIAGKVAAALKSSDPASAEAQNGGPQGSEADLTDDMAALADTQLRYEAEARLLHAAYARLRSAIGSNG
jgi:flagellar basal body rod protein FlgB